MSSKQDGKNREYEVAATELVDLEDFRKYMAEEEEEEAQRQASESEPSTDPSPAQEAASQEGHQSTRFVAPKAAPASEASPDNARLAAILGIVSLVPFLGIIVGPAAVMVANKQKQEIQAGRINVGTLQQTNIGLYLGAAGTAISILAVLFVAF